MATTVDVNHIYPTNLATPMTKAAGEESLRRVALRVAATSETPDLQAIFTLTDYLGPDGTAPTNFSIEEVEWSIETDTVTINFNADTDVVALRLQGAGFKDYRSVGGLVPDTAVQADNLAGLNMLAGADGDADISLVIRLKD